MTNMVETNKITDIVKDYKGTLILIGVGIMMLIVGLMLSLIKWAIIAFGCVMLVIAGVNVYKALNKKKEVKPPI